MTEAQKKPFNEEQVVLDAMAGVPVSRIAFEQGVSDTVIKRFLAGKTTRGKPPPVVLGSTPRRGEVAARTSSSGSKEPTTFTEMLELAGPDLWAYYLRATGPAKVQSYEAIRKGAERERAEGAANAEKEPFIADIVAGVSALSRERKQEILLSARVRMLNEITAIERAEKELASPLNRLEA